MIEPARTNDERTMLVAYLASKIGVTPTDLVGSIPFEVLAATREGKPVGALLYINYRKPTIEMTWAGEAGWLTPSVVREMFAYPFHQLGCLTILGTIDRLNKRSRDLAERLGCKVVGSIPDAFGEHRDGILYAMSRRECRWLKEDIPARELEAA